MMELTQVLGLMSSIRGCTFASLDAETKPSAGIRKIVEGESVILFTNKKTRSGYENMVRRRLEEAGLDPCSFVLGPLPWGTRIPETPIIEHKGEYYLQTILLNPGKVRTFIGQREVNPNDLPWLRSKNDGQGLPEGKQVVVRTYALSSITRLTALGETVTDRETA